MKSFITVGILFCLLMQKFGYAQPAPDSIMAKQLMHQKAMLSLSDAQFVKYQKLAKQFNGKLQVLYASHLDTTAFVKKANQLQDSYRDRLKELLDAEQWKIYKEHATKSRQQFEKDASDHHIKISGKANGID